MNVPGDRLLFVLMIDLSMINGGRRICTVADDSCDEATLRVAIAQSA
jgi:hypothetical protein